MSSRSHQHANVAVAVKARRGHQGGAAGERFEWGQALRGTAAGARFRGIVDEVLGIEFAQVAAMRLRRRASV